MSRRIGWPVPLLAVALAACGRGERLEAPPPTLTEDVEAPSPLPLSSLAVPVTYDLSPIIEKLEDVVPRRFGDLEDRDTLPSNRRVSFAFAAEREPLRVQVDGLTARISSVIHYRGRGWYDPPIGPTVSASCGTGDDDPPRRVRVALSADIDLAPDWTLQSRSRVDRVAPVSNRSRDRCRITVARIDVTDRLVRAARDLLRDRTDDIDNALAGLDVRSRFEEWWNILQSPIELTDSVWLLVNPVAVRRGVANGSGSVLSVQVGLAATPRIVVGQRPAIVPAPLPPLDTGAVSDGLHILVEGVVDYDVASKLLNDQLRGRTFEGAGQQIRIRDVSVSGIGGGRLALRVAFAGSARGTIYFVGTPRLDPITRQVSVPDLDFDVASEDLRVRGLAWLARDQAVAFLRERARFPVGDPVRLGRHYLGEGLNRNLSDDVRLDGEVIDVEPLEVFASRRVLLVRAHARATARLTIRDDEAAPLVADSVR